jgi:hypothetical protein
MSSATFDKSIGQLARDALADLGAIVSKEMRLGRTEVAEKVDRVASGLSGIATGVAILIPGITVILFAGANALVELGGVSPWVSMLIVGVVASLVGYLLLQAGRKNVQPSKLAPTKTLANVQRDAAAVKGTL